MTRCHISQLIVFLQNAINFFEKEILLFGIIYDSHTINTQ